MINVLRIKSELAACLVFEGDGNSRLHHKIMIYNLIFYVMLVVNEVRTYTEIFAYTKLGAMFFSFR